MRDPCVLVLVLCLLTALMATPLAASDQPKPPACDPKLGLVKMKPLITRLGGARMQDYPQTAVERRVLALGKKAIPMLIGCLTDERFTKLPVFNFWVPRVGDIALFLLSELFRTKKWATYAGRRDQVRNN